MGRAIGWNLGLKKTYLDYSSPFIYLVIFVSSYIVLLSHLLHGYILSFLEESADTFWRNELVWRITQSAEAFAPSNSWYVRVMTQVFKEAGELIKPDVAANLLALIAEGSGDEDAEADEQVCLCWYGEEGQNRLICVCAETNLLIDLSEFQSYVVMQPICVLSCWTTVPPSLTALCKSWHGCLENTPTLLRLKMMKWGIYRRKELQSSSVQWQEKESLKIQPLEAAL